MPENIPLADWDDPDVQIVYRILCDDRQPPDEAEHWEGWVARRIVGTFHVASQTKPVA